MTPKLKKPKIYWFLGLKANKDTGIMVYNRQFIDQLSSEFDITPIWFPKIPKFLFVFYRYLIFPLVYSKILFSKNYLKILPDESYAFMYIYPIKNSIIVIHHSHKDLEVNDLKERVYSKMIEYSERLLRRADKIICVSETTKRDLMKNYNLHKLNVKMLVIPNTINFNKFNHKINKSKLKKILFKKYNIKNNKKNIILCVGTDETRKNIRTLLLSLRKIPDTLLIRVGKSISAKNTVELEEIKNKFHLPVHHITYLEEEDYITLFKIVNLVVMPSTKEGFGRVIIESQAAGTPVVCSDISIFREVTSNSAILVKDILNPDSWSSKINELLNNKKELSRLSYDGQINACRYDSKLISKIFVKEIKSII